MDLFKEFKSDFPASIVVFFVALPLCLGIALASGAPLFSGVIAGIVGGILVASFSNSQLGVSGPAAGLATIVFAAVTDLGSFEALLLAVVLAGVLQFLLGTLKAGFVAYFVPTSVINGMLTAIGLLIIIKQLPYAVGYKTTQVEGEQFWHGSLWDPLISLASHITPAAVIIGIISMGILLLWNMWLGKQHRIFQILQGPIVVVLVGIGFNFLVSKGLLGNLSFDPKQLVQLPVPDGFAGILGLFTLPDFNQFTNMAVYEVAIVLALVASLETLLSVEAADKLDPYKRVTNTNQELRAQGIGNIVSGMIGGLPITQVIVRSSANIAFGAKTKLSAILHGVFLLISALTIASLLNMIPLASLAAILLVVGFNLAKPKKFVLIYKLGMEQFIPFVVTVAMIIYHDLLIGIAIGMGVALVYTLHHSYRNSYHMNDVQTEVNGRIVHHFKLAEEVSFFNKASVINALESVPAGSIVIIDCTNSKSIAYDVQEIIHDYQLHAELKEITVKTINFKPPEHLMGH